MDATVPARVHDLRGVFNGLRFIACTGMQWRLMPHDLRPWAAVYQQTRRWLAARCFEVIVHDLRAVLRLAQGRAAEPTAAILDSRTLQSTPESGHRAGPDGAKRRKASNVHLTVDTLGHLLALHLRKASGLLAQQAPASCSLAGSETECAIQVFPCAA